MKRIIVIMMCAVACSCSKPTVAEKEKMLWIAEASFMTHFSSQEKIVALLDRIERTGFNSIAVDIRPVTGDVLYRSEFMGMFEDAGTREYDYLQFMIDEARKRDIKVTAAATIFTAGHTLRPGVEEKNGPVWRDPALAALACVEYTPDRGLISILDDDGKEGAGGFAFLNPVHPETRKYALRFIEEIVAKYDIDGFSLDYCRFPDSESDFSEFTRGEFERFVGAEIENWPGDVFTYNPDGSHNKGEYYYQWWQFRAEVIHDFVKTARDAIKAIKPDVAVSCWTGSWLSKESGQNWASSSCDLAADPDQGADYREWLTADYGKAALADLLDTYLLGTYMPDTYMADKGPDGYRDPDRGADPWESMEYQIARGKRYVGDACPLYGNVTGTNPATTIEEQTYYCLTHTDGVMVFDLSHFATDDAKWAALKRGIDRAEGRL